MRKINQILAIIIFAIFSTASADDIDIIDSGNSLQANILFVMDLSGSMKWCPGAHDPINDPDVACGTGPSRLDELKGAFQDIINDPDFEEIDVGLSVFAGGVSGSPGESSAFGITYPVSPVIGDAANNTLAQNFLNSNSNFTHPGVAPDNSFMPDAGTMNTREYLGLLASYWASNGSTPIVDALYEASLYFRGEDVEAGKYPPSDIRAAHPSTFTGIGFSESTTTTTPTCDATSRQWCAKGSCGTTEQCTTSPGTTTSSTDTGGCTLNTGNTVGCGYGVPTCGLGTNCTNNVYTFDRFCGSSYPTVSGCAAAYPNWYACETYENTSSTTNSEGLVVTTTTTQVRCKEDMTYYWCDGPDNYSCPTTVENCTKCPNDETTTEITGSGTYKSPIVDECTKNGIILLSDGGPTANTTADLIRGKIGTYAQGCQNAPSPGTETQVFGRCGPELAKFLAEEDHADGSTSVPDIDGVQGVSTYTVGLSLTAGSEASDFLEEIATEGAGAFVSANSRAELTEAFKSAIIGIAESQARSFASPSYSINTTDLLSHGNTVYVPVFDKDGVVWPGNLKKYQIIDGVLSDADGDPALDSSGSLLVSARDMWSTEVPTDVIKSGGAANKIDPATRNIKTDNGSTLIALNTGIANSAFGLGTSTADDNLKADLVKYIKGSNADDTPRNHMGDIIHSKPVQLIKAGATTADADKKYVFVGTNEGYIHAINDADGTEEFAYMPQELLVNINTQYSKTATPNHLYGVDGPITLWLDETTTKSDPLKYGNNILDAGEKAYLFFGLRRGGKYYYALEVTDPTTPVLKWKAQFGTGDSWSKPVVAMLKQGTGTGDPTPVLVIGGGYNEDASGVQTNGGNAVYIVDAVGTSTGGDVIWTTPTNSTLAPDGAIASTDAVPSRIRVLDIDRNGSIDRLYFGDTGGNIWRVDLNASNYATTPDNNNVQKAKMYKLAALGGSGADNRKFFEEPDVAIFNQAGNVVATVAIGSGDRTKPLDATVDDRFFVLYDKEVYIEPTASTITMNTSTGGLKASSAVTSADLSTATFRGWHKDLTSSTGEKVLSTAVTFNNKVMFSTFGTTGAVSTTACGSSNTNEAHLYIMDLLSANEDTNIVAATGEILGTPNIIFGELKQQGTDTACDVAGGDKNCERKVMVRVGKAGPFAIPTASGSPTTGGLATPDALPRVYWLDNEK